VTSLRVNRTAVKGFYSSQVGELSLASSLVQGGISAAVASTRSDVQSEGGLRLATTDGVPATEILGGCPKEVNS